MISIDESRCTLCGLCEPMCVRRILQPGEKSMKVVDPGMCIFCGHCKAVCPVDAPVLSNLDEKEFEPIPAGAEMPAPPALFHFFRRRRSLRLYKKRPVEVEKLERIIEAGRFAPTGGNRQGCEYVVVNGRESLDRICSLTMGMLQAEGRRIEEAVDRARRLNEPLSEKDLSRQNYPQVWDRLARKWKEGADQLFHHAPALIVIHQKAGVAATPEVDAGIASLQMVLMAEALGLGTCYIGFLIVALENSEELRDALRIPPGNQAQVALTVGYPDVEFLKLVARNPARIEWIGDSPRGAAAGR